MLLTIKFSNSCSRIESWMVEDMSPYEKLGELRLPVAIFLLYCAYNLKVRECEDEGIYFRENLSFSTLLLQDD